MFETFLLLQFLDELIIRMERKNKLAVSKGVKRDDAALLELRKMQAVRATLQDYERVTSELARYDGLVLDLKISEKLEEIIAGSGAFAALREMLRQYQRVSKKLAIAERVISRMSKAKARESIDEIEWETVEQLHPPEVRGFLNEGTGNDE